MKRNTVEKFWSLVATAATDECWPWLGWRNPHGYGTFRLDGKKRLVHRIAYMDKVGPLGDALTIDHLCTQHDCCNPAHLEAVDSRTNARRGGPTHGARRQRCRAGHPTRTRRTTRYSGRTGKCAAANAAGRASVASARSGGATTNAQ